MTLFARLFKTMTNPWVVLCSLGLIGLSIFYIDKPLALYLHHIQFGYFKLILKVITTAGMAEVYFVLLGALFLFFRYIRKNKVWEERVWFILICLMTSSIVCWILKVIIGRARPQVLFEHDIYGFYGFQTHSDYWSFPSGHTSTVMSLAFAISVFFPRFTKRAIFLGFLVVITRVLLTRHFLGDVMMASYLALLEVGLLTYWLRRKMTYNSVSIS